MDNPFARFKLAIEQEKQVAQKPRFKSERAELFNELYGHYSKCYRKDTWEAYKKWLQKNKLKHTAENTAKFKKSPDYRKKITIKSFCSFWLGFVATNDLYYLISIAKDKEARGENFNKWLFWALK